MALEWFEITEAEAALLKYLRTGPDFEAVAESHDACLLIAAVCDESRAKFSCCEFHDSEGARGSVADCPRFEGFDGLELDRSAREQRRHNKRGELMDTLTKRKYFRRELYTNFRPDWDLWTCQVCGASVVDGPAMELHIRHHHSMAHVFDALCVYTRSGGQVISDACIEAEEVHSLNARERDDTEPRDDWPPPPLA